MDHEAHKLASPAPAASTAPTSEWEAWNKWCDSRIEAKLVSERRFFHAVMAGVVAELIAREKKPEKRSISKRRAQARQRAK